MACLIRQMKVSENSFTENYINNGQTYEDDYLSITSTNRHSTEVTIKVEEWINFEVLKKGYIETQYDPSVCLNRQLNRVFLDTQEIYLEIWHMSQECLNTICEYINAPHSRTLG